MKSQIEVMRLVKNKELIKKWYKDRFSLRLYTDYKRDQYGKIQITYVFRDHGKVIFYGDDFYPSPMYAIDSLDSVYSLLSFLSLGNGDVDSEYFNTYNQDQLDWRDSDRREELNWLVFEYDERTGKL